MDTPESLARELAPLVLRFCAGPCALALGGSCAKDGGDAHSDVDLYLFSDAVIPAARRVEIVREALGAEAGAVSWGADEPWVQGGTDFVVRGRRVEVWLRSVAWVEREMADALAGRVRREYVAWTAMGFFPHVVLSDVATLRPLHDPDGTLARWQAAVAAYPEPLRDALLRHFIAEAAFWPGNPHYESAVARGDVLYATAIAQQVAQALIQVVFALNRVYFPGEKRLAAALAKLPLQPRDFAARLASLVTTPDLRAQSDALATLVSEVKAL